MDYRPNDLVSTVEAAAIKGVHPATVRKACEEGDLKAQKVNERAWVIKWRELEKWSPKKVRRTKAEIAARKG